ncbi:MAG TPA: hypothetical protein VMZ28_26275 [Kofleriaceae bacterium]|nr:hypothetical protein [Kofleriaceae bacterium]
MEPVRYALAALAALTLGACFPFPPEADTADALGPEADGVEQGPLHRPGQPCLVCHGEDYTRGGVVFALAGTIYREAPDRTGERDASVVMTDADGREFTARTNAAGTFFVEVDTALSAPQQREEGRLDIDFDPTFPITVEVARGDAPARHMRSAIYREGSCSACHLADVDETSAGRVVLEGDP